MSDTNGITQTYLHDVTDGSPTPLTLYPGPATLSSYTPANECRVEFQVNLYGLKNTAAWLTAVVRNTTDGYDVSLTRQSFAKATATDVGTVIQFPPFTTIANKAYAVLLQSNNTADINGGGVAITARTRVRDAGSMPQTADLGTIKGTDGKALISTDAQDLHTSLTVRSYLSGMLTTALTETSTGYLQWP